MLKKRQKNIMYNIMELNLSELDNINTMNPYDTFDYNSYEQQNDINYWEKPKEEIQSKKKKVSFNDILSNMNLVVNKQGILQFMTPVQQQDMTPVHQEYSTIPNYNYNSNNFIQPDYFQQQPLSNKNITVNKTTEPLEQAVKHSYIYNKYFKDYVDPNIQKPGPRVPKTIEEYNQMILDDRKKAIEHKIRIEQIKSKKLIFTSPPGITGVNPRNIVPTKNNLRSMKFN